MKLANKKGNEVGPEVVDDIEIERVNVVSNTQLKVSYATQPPTLYKRFGINQKMQCTCVVNLTATSLVIST